MHRVYLFKGSLARLGRFSHCSSKHTHVNGLARGNAFSSLATKNTRRSATSAVSFDLNDTHNTTPATKNPVPNFEDPRIAFDTKSTKELLRAGLSFGLCQITPLVHHAESLLRMTRKVCGDRITDSLLKATLFGHFCAGENIHQVKQVAKKMQEAANIGSILDYAAEDDGQADSVHGKQTKAKSKLEELAETVLVENHPKVRTYVYVDEAECDRHTQTFVSCIRDASKLQEGAYAAIKVSALVDPKLLARMSRAVVELQNLFLKFDTDQNGFVTKDEFQMGVDLFFDPAVDTYMRDIAEQIDLEVSDGMIDYVTWSKLLRPEDLPQVTRGCRSIGPLAIATPSEEELGLMARLRERIHSVAKEAAEHNVRLLVDAEQNLYQPAIDSFVLDLEREFNDPSKTDFPIIYNTYQCYLKDSEKRLAMDLERSERMGYHFGAKLVRGAYMESERELALKLGYPSPIHDTIEDTHTSYDNSVRYLLEQSVKEGRKSNLEFMLASHNQESIQRAVSVMNDLGIDRRDPVICFAQLYGMMDHVTYALGKLEYRAFKYVPYGEVKLAMPYLIRRANENSAIAGGASRELGKLTTELKRRIFG
ncbi:proline dehydrogenase [Fistulifera solaris]|uniref:Proline dehydrogenase n=1 Tax=Fistulifera solaris TaxID=1519565 RepID=A0A1Z5KNX6_FISSO|nr:proline dehydrogenase [Fistulifera solaris]|eukprot:GAX27792.1 proline dehydrogenase [Fistulifera solaris]